MKKVGLHCVIYSYRVFSNTDMSMNGPREEPGGECEGEG